MAEEENNKAVQGLIGLVVVIAAIWYFYGGGLEKQTATNLQELHESVAADFEKQYYIAKRQGTAVDAYVQAGIVAASYLHAKDEVNYRRWKAIEKQEAAAAGMPQ